MKRLPVVVRSAGRLSCLLAKRLLTAVLAGWSVCCGGVAAAASPSPPHVLLIAVGDEQPVFDRFVSDLARRFEGLETAGVAIASSSGRVGRRIDAPDDAYAAIRGLRGERRLGEPGDASSAAPGGCVVYLTGHGTPAGLSMPLGAASAPPASPGRRYAPLKARELAAALRDGCGDAPTVVIASACYSGVYLAGRFGRGLRGAHRVVLTAAAADRPSFGCGDDQTYTYYDGCFLRSLDEALAAAAASAATTTAAAQAKPAPTWRDLAERTRACVAERERTLGRDSRPSLPQSFFGGEADTLTLPRAR